MFGNNKDIVGVMERSGGLYAIQKDGGDKNITKSGKVLQIINGTDAAIIVYEGFKHRYDYKTGGIRSI
jgi:hypothetical protein